MRKFVAVSGAVFVLLHLLTNMMLIILTTIVHIVKEVGHKMLL